MAAQGWLKGEPEEPEVERPELVQLALEEVAKHFRASPSDVCRRLHWQRPVFERVSGVTLPEETPVTAEGQVVQLDLFRAERMTR